MHKCEPRTSTFNWQIHIYDQTGSEHLNCKIFATTSASMSGYLNSCNPVGGPLRNKQDNCLGDLTDTYCGNANFCPGGCASCAADRCNDFAETECTMTSMAASTISSAATDASTCQAAMTPMGSSDAPITYFTFDQWAWLCAGYPSGGRVCTNVVAAKNMDIQSCQTL